MSKVHRGDIAGESGLPPEEYWLVDPAAGRIDTPVDERGLIRVDQLISDVKATIDPAYQWPSHVSVHHIYWWNGLYEGREAQQFREIAPHKVLVPRVFENWLHRITAPCAVPDADVMRERRQAYAVAKSLFSHAREIVVWEKRGRRREDQIIRRPETLPIEFAGEDRIGKAYIQSRWQRHFDSFQEKREAYSEVPEEVRLVRELAYDPPTVAQQLGIFTTRRAMPLVNAVRAA